MYWVAVHHTGGLVGRNTSTVIASHAGANVSGANDVGGLIGRNSGNGTIAVSYSTGNVSGTYVVGGLVGFNNGTIISTYSYANVTGSSNDIGGLVGHSYSDSIITSYSIGRVSITGDADYYGGLVGFSEASAITTASYWNTENSSQYGSYGGAGKTTRELQAPTGYTGIYTDWNADVDGDDRPDDPWDFGTSTQYPVLKYGGLDVVAQRP